MVSGNNQSFVSRTKKLPDSDNKRSELQENTESLETIPVSPEDSERRTIGPE